MKNELSQNIAAKINHTSSIFFICCLRFGSPGVQQTQKLRFGSRSKKFGK